MWPPAVRTVVARSAVTARARCGRTTGRSGIGTLAAVLLAPCCTLLGADCNRNGDEDAADVEAGSSADCNQNGVPDECEFAPLRRALLDGDFPVVSPQAAVAVDLNGDGFDDWASGNRAAELVSSISVFLSRGDRSFAPEVDFDAGEGLSAVAAADFDGDADIDLASANDSQVLVLRNDGTGAFSAPLAFPVPARTVFLNAADVTGDGLADLVATNTAEHSVLVLDNQGDAMFGVPVSTAVGRFPRSVLAVDLDGDGDTDLATVNRLSDDISILLNTSGGSFMPAASYAAGGSNPLRLSSGDMDGDGDVDLATATLSSVSVVLNDDGTFTAPVSYAGRVRPTSLLAADLDGDADVDLAFGNALSENVFVRVNAGNGTFPGIAALAAGWTPRVLTAGDFDGDADLDLAATVGDAEASRLALLWNSEAIGPETLVFGSAVIGGRVNPHSLTMADLDGDGHLDVATADGSRGGVSTLLGDGDGNLVVNATYQHNPDDGRSRMFFIVDGDIDGDGDLDLAIADTLTDRIHVRRNAGDGTFGDVTLYAAGAQPNMLAMADVDGDADLDLLAVTPPANNIALFLNTGKGVFSDPRNVRVGNQPLAVAVHDFDDDGALDLAVVNFTSSDVSIHWNEGDGTFLPAVFIPVVKSPRFLVGADPDGDGDMDLLAVHDGALLLFRNEGERLFSSAGSFATGQPHHSLVTADLDSDGFLDVVTANTLNPTFGSLSLLLGSGDGTFLRPRRLITGAEPRFVVAGDLDEDGDTDLVSANRLSENLTILLSELAVPEDSLETICTDRDFHTVSVPSQNGGDVKRQMSYLVPAGDTQDLPTLFPNVGRFSSPREFLATVFPERFAGLGEEEFSSVAGRRAMRQYFSGEIRQLRDENGLAYGFTVFTDDSDPGELLTLEEVRGLFDVLSLSFQLRSLAYLPDSSLAADIAVGWTNPGFPIYGLPAGNSFRRGDVNADGPLDITDALSLLRYLFQRGSVPSCRKAADTNDDGRVNVGDAVSILQQILGRVESIAPPFPACGEDPTGDRLSCASYAACE
jgi:hypothetical protein